MDANLNILRQRIEELKRKETLTICCTLRKEWCYRSVYVPKPRLETMLSESVELMALATGSFGFVFLSGSLCICIVSLLAHLGNWHGVH